MPNLVDHIPAQNQAGADLANVQTRFQAAVSSNTLTEALRAQLAAEALAIGTSFRSYAYSVGTDRARNGGNEIYALAQSISNNIASAPLSQGPVAAAPVATGYANVTAGPADTLPGELIVSRQPATAAPAIPGAAALVPGAAADYWPTDPTSSPVAAPAGDLGQYVPYIAGGLLLAYLVSGGGRRRG
jgi:hypothetical protein